MKEQFEHGEKALIRKVMLKQISEAKHVFNQPKDQYGVTEWKVTTKNDSTLIIHSGGPEMAIQIAIKDNLANRIVYTSTSSKEGMDEFVTALQDAKSKIAKQEEIARNSDTLHYVYEKLGISGNAY